jgi:ParB-like chromosome segregation protein Spo0J
MATKKIEAKKMSNDKGTAHATASEILPEEVIKHIPISDIFADFDWNSRSQADVRNEQSDAVQDTTSGRRDVEGTGLKGLALTIRAAGQDTPVILKNTANGKSISGKKTDKPYELICGFRRFVAIGLLNEAEHLEQAKKLGQNTVPNTANGTIRAVVRKLTNTEAKLLNGRENTARSNLRAQDTMMLVRDLAKDGMNQTQIADGLGISQPYVNKLLAISALPGPILDHWREGKTLPGLAATTPPKQLTVAELVDLAGVAKTQPSGEVIGRYVRMLAPQADPANPGASPADDPAVKRVTEVGRMLGALVKAGVLEPGSLDWARVIGPKKKSYLIDSGTADHVKIMALVDVMGDAFEKAAEPDKRSTTQSATAE